MFMAWMPHLSSIISPVYFFYWDCGLKDIVLRTALRLYLDQVGIHRKTRGLDSHAHAPNSQKDSIYSMASIQNMLFVYS